MHISLSKRQRYSENVFQKGRRLDLFVIGCEEVHINLTLNTHEKFNEV